jgi:hypothetical protein
VLRADFRIVDKSPESKIASAGSDASLMVSL